MSANHGGRHFPDLSPPTILVLLPPCGYVDIIDGRESDDEEQPTDCISKPVFKGVMNAITVLEDCGLF